ncbi:MAG TPA: FtsX-like permease family protein, partial [Blastocatellia bacterium]|nr:FtsX-like permease family protein [Blastocatellia bacterium]
RGTTSDKSLFRNGLVVVEIALALILLTGASLLIKSFTRLQRVDTGFRPQGTLTMGVFLPPAKYETEDKIVSFFRQLDSALAARREVDSVGAVTVLPLSGNDDRIHFTIAGAPTVAPADRPIAQIRSTIGDYFKAQGIPFLEGRMFSERDGKDSPGIAIVNHALAATFFPSTSPLGKRIALEGEDSPREIVGEVGDVRVDALDVAVRPQVYVPLPQNAAPYMSFVVRGASSSIDLRPTVRQALGAVDSGLPISDVRTMDEILAGSVSQQRFSMLVMSFLAGLAAILAAIGIYGVMAYSVSKRTSEIGIRMAMGAQPAEVVRLILKRGITLTAMGIVAGLAGSFALVGLISSLLYSVKATDPSVFLIVTLGAAAVAILACYIPARRATRVDPMIALRQ